MLYNTFAINAIVSNNNDTYTITLTEDRNTVTVPAGSSKTIYYHIKNTNKGKVKYGVGYNSDTSIEVKVYSDSQDKETDLIDYGSNKFIKLYLNNTTSSNSSVTLSTILGYEHGGDLIVPSGVTLVTEVYTPPKIDISQDNSTLNITPISNAVSYNVYSNNTLLTNTTDTNIEIYKHYTTPGTYNIKVNAVMSDNTEKQVGTNINYTINQLNNGKYLDMFFVTCGYIGCSLLEPVSLSEIISYVKSDFILDKNIKNIHVCETVEHENYCKGPGCFNVLDYQAYSFDLLEPNNCYDGPLEDLYLSIRRCDYDCYMKYDTEINDITFYGANSMNGYDINFDAYFTAPGYINSNSFVGTFMLYCLSSDTEVIVYDKKKKKRRKKKIKDVTYDDLLLVWDFDKGCFTYAKPLWIMRKHLAGSYNLIRFSDGSTLKTVSDHRIFNKEKGKFTYTMSDETPIGTTTFNSKGEYVQVVSKEVINDTIEFCNIITTYHINLFANGILTSCRLSNLYKIENMKYVKDDRKLNTKEELNTSDKWYYGLRLSEQDKNINKDNNSYKGESINDYINNLEESDIRN